MFDNVIMNRPGVVDDEYQTPSKQVVVLKGLQATNPISLPGLQQYFTNVQMPGREYAQFQVAFFDFPRNDSITKILGDTSVVNLKITTYLKQATWWNLDDVAVYDTFYHASSSLTVTRELGVKRIHSPGDATEIIRTLFSTITPTNTSGDQAQLILQFLKDISYDPVLNKHVVTYQNPGLINMPVYNTQNSTPMYPVRVLIEMYSDHTGQQAKMLAALFGGKTLGPDQNPTGWISQIDTGYTRFFQRIYSMLYDSAIAQLKYTWYQTYEVASMRPIRMYIDPYVYIRGTPEHSIWSSTGEQSNVIAILPRNRQPGSPPADQALLSGQSHFTKASLSSLRNMTLTITDSYGNPVQLDEEFLIKIAIEFSK